MSKIKYASDKFSEHMAKALGRDLPISTKHGVNICRMIRGKTTVAAKKLLEEVISLKRAVPYKRYYRELSHKRKIGPGKVRRKPNTRKQDYVAIVRKLRNYAYEMEKQRKITKEELRIIKKRIRNREFKNKTDLKEYIRSLEK